MTRVAARAVLLAAVGTLAAPPAPAQSLRTVTLARQARGEADLRVDVDFVAGAITIAPGEPGTLYRAAIVYHEDRVEPSVNYDPDARRLRIAVGEGRITAARGEWKDQRLDLRLSPAVSTRLDLDVGAAETALDLGGLALTRVDVSIGASATEVDFSRPNRVACERLSIEVGAAELVATRLGNSRCRRLAVSGAVGKLVLDFTGRRDAGAEMHADVEFGLGELTLRLPADLGVAVTLDRLLVGFERHGLVRRGNGYYTANFDTASERLLLDIRAAFGDVKIEWVSSER